MYLLQGFVTYYGRSAILSYGLLPPGGNKHAMLSVLLDRLYFRDRDSEESIQGRIKNAERDLAFFTERADLFKNILVNDDIESIVSILEEYVIQVIGKL